MEGLGEGERKGLKRGVKEQFVILVLLIDGIDPVTAVSPAKSRW